MVKSVRFENYLGVFLRFEPHNIIKLTILFWHGFIQGGGREEICPNLSSPPEDDSIIVQYSSLFCYYTCANAAPIGNMFVIIAFL